MKTVVDEDRVRGNVYALLGNLLAGPPDDDLLQVLRGISPDPGDESLLAASWQLLAVAAGRANRPELREEYDALFIGVGRGEVVPYGSWYLTGFLMEQPLAQLRGDLRALGIERQAGVYTPAPLDEQQRFYARHLEPWLPRFFRDLQQAASARFYRAVGQLGEQFIGVESQAFRVTTPAAGAATPS